MARKSPPPTLTASGICDALGRAAIADRIGVKLAAVSNASVAGKFPAAWFTTIQAMCAERGLPSPDYGLFRFKGAVTDSKAESAA